MAFIPKDWRDASQDLTTPITAAALENLETRVTAGIPYENVLWHGAVGTDTGDQTAAIQAAIDTLEESGGTVYIPRGTYRMLGSLQLHDRINLLGDGSTASVLSWAASAGADTWALTPNPPGDRHYGVISSLHFKGPGSWTGTYGSAVSNMNGVKITARQRVEKCAISLFHRGLGVVEDHLNVSNCAITSNTYNLAYLAGSGGGGDHHYISCDLAGASIASVYIESTQGILGSFFLGCHLGLAPYGLLTAAGKAGNGFMYVVTFINSPIEFFGTAAIWGANATDRIDTCRFINCGATQFNGFLLPSTTYEYFVRSGLILRSLFDLATFPGSVPGTAYFSASGDGNNLESLEFYGGGQGEFEDNDTRFLHQTAGAGVTFCSFSGPISRRGRFCQVTDGAVVKGNLLRTTGNNECTKYDTAGRAALGMALQNGAVGEIIAVQTEGWTNLIVADGVIGGSGIPLKPAPTAGRVVAAANFGDGPIVGVSTWAPATVAGSAFDAHIRCGTWG